jgi:xanthine/uracil/vitamin C permease (AzgA family)
MHSASDSFNPLAYIIFVQPMLLSGAIFGKSARMDFHSVRVATCLSPALAIAQARPGQGQIFSSL